MKIILTIFGFLFSLNCFSQDNLTFVFDFDSTKIYLKYSDILSVLKKENEKLKDKSKLIAKHDTLILDRYFISENQNLDSSEFKLDIELFIILNRQLGTITYKNHIVKSFYTKTFKHRIHRRKLFKGIYYFDTETKKHFLTKTIYQLWYTPYPLNF